MLLMFAVYVTSPSFSTGRAPHTGSRAACANSFRPRRRTPASTCAYAVVVLLVLELIFGHGCAACRDGGDAGV